MLLRELLHLPLHWWVLAAGCAWSLLVGIGFYLGPGWGIGTAAASLVVATGLFVHTAIVLVVEPQGIRIGRAWIEHRYIRQARALDAEATRRRGGVEADARAHLVLRPYVATAVEITLADPADPVPYWLVSSRRAEELAAALTSAIGSRSPTGNGAGLPPGQDDFAQ